MNKIKRDASIIDYYVCPRCFHKIVECTCNSFPTSSITWVDKAIQDVVRVLNEKGYVTTNSCESHDKHDSIYVTFTKYNGIDTAIKMPNGFSGNKFGTIIEYHYDKNLAPENFQSVKAEKIHELLEWCKSLPNHHNKKHLDLKRSKMMR